MEKYEGEKLHLFLAELSEKIVKFLNEFDENGNRKVGEDYGISQERFNAYLNFLGVHSCVKRYNFGKYGITVWFEDYCGCEIWGFSKTWYSKSKKPVAFLRKRDFFNVKVTGGFFHAKS